MMDLALEESKAQRRKQGLQFSCHTTRQIFYSFAVVCQWYCDVTVIRNSPCEASFDCAEVPMRLCVCFLEKRQPCFVLTATLREVKRFRARLICFSILLFGIVSVDLGEYRFPFI